MVSFKDKVKMSFLTVQRDVTQLKENVVEWVTTIVTNQKKLLEKVKELEERLNKLDKKK